MTHSALLRVVGLALAGALVAACERPPMQSTQLGYRGVGLVEIDNPRLLAVANAANSVPVPLPQFPAEGQRASEVYTNVQIPELANLSVAQFTRLMTTLVTWVAPTEGCVYCHVGENFASDDIYTKVVSRRMLQMTLDINRNWTQHVGTTGVTCYTCHRGQAVPGEIWYEAPEHRGAGGFAALSGGQNAPAEQVGLTSLPSDPLTSFLRTGGEIRAQSTTALPGAAGSSIQATESTYALMMHMSDSLGVNCGHCHNSRAFAPWEESSPARVTAWHGIRLARHINADYLDPLVNVFPATRLGPTGDAPKASCATCHRGSAKPLGGAPMLADYPELQAN